MEMRDSKAASINGRKRLNEITRSFRGKQKEDQLGMMTEVLKAYQEEIDQLIGRCKYSETSFYQLYKAVYDAPDPSQTIEQLNSQVSNVSSYQLEIERMRGEIMQYEQEFQQLKNQDITIRRLEETIQEYKDRIEDKVAEEVMKRTSEIEDRSISQVNDVKESHRALEKRLAATIENMSLAQVRK